ncbi:Lrp/AsnC family transcriptional regulator [Virgibacillus sp. W0430]|uniref:Lrp/AsnC family transcriptional regulator n=1 Tax=Virgibacillus sp. W0430 TaxID=3391580 RepID=UPI003F4652A1
MKLDQMDKDILEYLQRDSNITNAELARKLNISPPAMHGRVKRLYNDGFIDKHVLILNASKLGFDLLCFIFLNTNVHQLEQLNQFEAKIQELPQVLECYTLTGEYDYMLKVVNKNSNNLQHFIRQLNGISEITRIQTSISLREVKFSTELPIGDEQSVQD